MRTIAITIATLTLLLAQPVSRMLARADSKPNFIIFFADDQGYNDLGCFGSPSIRTPNIDALAESGMRFTDFYSAASVCTPSRAALLTGCYPERVGNLPVLFPHSDRGLAHDEVTIAELLKETGYATACIGKWHLGHHREFLPTQHGFDQYFGVPYSNDMGVDPTMTLAANIQYREGQTAETFRTASGRLPPLMRDEQIIQWPVDQTQLTKRYTDEAVSFIETHQEQPWFLYLPYTMPHVPLYVSDSFRGKSEAGLYGDAIEEIDASVGRISETLKTLNLFDNTVIVYTSDNGPWNFPGMNDKKVKGNLHRRVGGSADPLRGFKFSSWEGGMRVPCVMCWPKGISSGVVNREIVGTIDLLPTFAELAGAAMPENVIDGKSIVPLFDAGKQKPNPRTEIFYRTQGVRKGDWKLVDGGKLFNLKDDISESRDVSADNPQVVAELQALLEDHKRQMNADARRPATYQREPFPLAADPSWVVHSGRWSSKKSDGIRQHSDWTRSELRTDDCPARVERIQVEARRTTNEGSVSLSAGDEARSRIRVSLDSSAKLTIESNATVLQFDVPEVNPEKWHTLRLEFKEQQLVVSILQGVATRSFQIDSDCKPAQLALGAEFSKAEFRNLEAIGASEEKVWFAAAETARQ